MVVPGATEAAKGPTSAVSDVAVAHSFDGIDVAVLLPTLNEEEGLYKTLKDLPLEPLRAAGWRIRPLVVDGGSTDSTLAVAATAQVPVLQQKSLGKGGAIREALEYLRSEGVQYVVVLDADCTYPGEAIGPTLCLLKAGSQLVVGIRTLAPLQVRRVRTVIHRVGNNMLNYLAAQLSHHSILDLCSGFWGLDLSAGIDRTLATNGFDIEAELFLAAYGRGLAVTQIPIAYHKRVGKAKLRAFQDGFRIFLTVLRVGPSAKFSLSSGKTDSGSLLRDVLSVCLVASPSEVIVVSPPSRVHEAATFAAQLRGSGLTPRMVVEPTDLAVSAAIGTEFSSLGPSLPSRAVVVLPENQVGRATSKVGAAVLLPRSGRLVYVGGDSVSSISGGRAGLTPLLGAGASLGGYAQETRSQSDGHLRWVSALGQQLNSSPETKELAMLDANDGRSSVSVWKRPARTQKNEEKRPPFGRASP